MNHYTKGMYCSYDKNHKERAKLDYYATPPNEVLNILKSLEYDFSNLTILEPCCGGCHMVKGIVDYLDISNQKAEIVATDVHDHKKFYDFPALTGDEYDFLGDNYPIFSTDWVIMNPPYSTIEPFLIRSLEIAKHGVIMLARLQVLEGIKRYNKIFKDNPPTDIYVYIDRIGCWKNGDIPTTSSAQAYAWFVWNKDINKEPVVHWIHRVKE